MNASKPQRPRRRLIDVGDPADVFVASIEGIVRAEQCDYNGHLNMAAYVVIFDRLADAALASLGVGEAYAQRERRSYFASKLGLRFAAELIAGDAYVAEATLAGYGARRMLTRFQLRSMATQAVAAAALFEWAHVDLSTRRAVDLGQPLLALLSSRGCSHHDRDPLITI